MESPFPGMDPYLEHPSLWPDVHNRLIAALADDLSERVAPRYYVGLERRTYLLKTDDLVFIGRPDIAVASAAEVSVLAPQPATSVTVLEVEVPMQDEVSENFLEIHEVKTGKLITILELLSPVNKLHKQGREEYERQRGYVFRSWTNLVELDLLRAGDPMPVVGTQVQSDYRILMSVPPLEALLTRCFIGGQRCAPSHTPHACLSPGLCYNRSTKRTNLQPQELPCQP